MLALSVAAPVYAKVEPERVRAAASARYDTGWLHRIFFGEEYRRAWAVEVELPVLEPSRVGGGIVPTRRFGGLQSAVLGFAGPDGRSYTFRVSEKDASAALEEPLRRSIVGPIVRDQGAAQHPGAGIVASALAREVGILEAVERMVVMADDPVLGEYREEFGGRVGSFFEYPMPAAEGHPGFHGATEILYDDALYERLARGYADRVDVEAFLHARLFDLVLGDWDRHRKQWRWAKLPGERLWQPVPEDRDAALSRSEGLLPRISSLYVPEIQHYGPHYPSLRGLTMLGWEQDRWLLPALSWDAWQRIALALRAQLDDAAIDRALSALPPEYVELDGDALRAGLTGRRDRLLEGARAFYEHLAREVDVQGSDSSERVEVARGSEGFVTVTIFARTADLEEALVFRRRFDPEETEEVRIYLRGGDDRVEVVGPAGPIELRVVAGEGRKRVDDSAGGGTRIYDAGSAIEVSAGPGTHVVKEPYAPPEPGRFGAVEAADERPRDWRSDTIPVPQLGFERDVGPFIGGGVIHTRYGFRRHPWSSRHSLGAGWGFEADAPRAYYRGDFRLENSSTLARIDLLLSGIETLRFYGFGNETSDARGDSFHRVLNEQYRVEAVVLRSWADEFVRLSAGPWMQISDTRSQPGRLIAQLDPYGSGNFGAIGMRAHLQLDTRSTVPEDERRVAFRLHDDAAAGYPLRGFVIDLDAEISPPVWDVKSTWGSIGGSASVYLTPGFADWATLALRVGGMQTFGNTPYFAAAYIGGGEFFSGTSNVRGYRAQRFGGDASVYGGSELRLVLGSFESILPGDFGVLGFGDVGRVFLDGESSGRWHPSGGGGLWFAPLARTNAVSLTIGHSSEETLVYLRTGFHY